MSLLFFLFRPCGWSARADGKERRRTPPEMGPGDSQGGRAGDPPAPEEKGSDAIADARLPETQERANGGGPGGEDDARAAVRRPLRHERAGLEPVQHVVVQGEDLVRRLGQPGVSCTASARSR